MKKFKLINMYLIVVSKGFNLCLDRLYMILKMTGKDPFSRFLKTYILKTKEKKSKSTF